MRSENIDCLTCALVVITVLLAQSVSQQRSANDDVCRGTGVSPNSGSARENCLVSPIFATYKDTMELLQRNLFLVTCIVVILGPHVDGGGGPTSRKGESLRPV